MNVVKWIMGGSRSDDDEVDLREYVLGSPIYTSIVFEGIHHAKFIVKASKLVPNIMSWAYNRDVDTEHVRKLQDELMSMTHPHFIGSVKLVCSSEDRMGFKLLDGQHRIMALANIMKVKPDFDMSVDVDMYCTSDDMSTLELFIKSNNNKNVDVMDIPDRKIIEIVELCIKFWPEYIKTDDTKRANRPNIHKRALYNAIRGVADKHPDWTPKQWARRIYEMNDSLRTKPLVELFGTDKLPRQKLTTYERARKNDFFLNLDCVFCIDKWVHLL